MINEEEKILLVEEVENIILEEEVIENNNNVQVDNYEDIPLLNERPRRANTAAGVDRLQVNFEAKLYESGREFNSDESGKYFTFVTNGKIVKSRILEEKKTTASLELMIATLLIYAHKRGDVAIFDVPRAYL